MVAGGVDRTAGTCKLLVVLVAVFVCPQWGGRRLVRADATRRT